MIDVKEAVRTAKQKAADMLEEGPASLEEIEREDDKGCDTWNITLGFLPGQMGQIAKITRMAVDPLHYRRFLIDAETGEPVHRPESPFMNGKTSEPPCAACGLLDSVENPHAAHSGSEVFSSNCYLTGC